MMLPAQSQIGKAAPTALAVQQFRSRVLLPLLLATAAAILAAILGFRQAAHNSDAIAAERQRRETQQAMSAKLDELALAQEVVAVWDPIVLELRKAQRDWQWVDDNIASWLKRVFGHDEVYIL